MGSLFHLYHDLKKRRPDLTQQDLVAESGLSLATIQRIAADPCYRPKKVTCDAFEGMYELLIPPIWPDSIAKLRKTYLTAEKGLRKDDFRVFLEGFEVALQ